MKEQTEERLNFHEMDQPCPEESVQADTPSVDSANLLKVAAQPRSRRIYIKIGYCYEDSQVVESPGIFIKVDEPRFILNYIERNGYLSHPKSIGCIIGALLTSQAFQVENAHQGVYNTQAEKQEGFLPIEHPRPKQVTRAKKDQISFGCMVTRAVLMNELLKMDKKMHILAPHQKMDVLVDALMCDDWTTVKDLVYLHCQTIKFKCIIKYLKKYFTALSFANIGRSGLFVSCSGNRISATNMGSTNCTTLEKKHFIENILS